ncbi:MAG: ABC transporter substrate-binding protein [Rhodobacterales bacterium]|nr:ABC transporter substrate-binding protein [Rhodobacterales bacterium]
MTKRNQSRTKRAYATTALDSAARSGSMSRRSFLNSAAIAGIGVGAASGLWTTRAQAAPQKGGTFRFGAHDGNSSDTHDPGTYVSRQQIYLAHQYRSYLTMINPDGSLGNDLATGWEPNGDATVWTFEITPNATFHSGKPVTSEDVVNSLNFHRGEKSTSAAKTLLTSVTDIRADGDHTIVIELDGGNADVPWLMTDYHFAVCPSDGEGGIDWKSGDGSGPYKIDDGDWGVQFRLSRHEGWHLEGAYFDKLVMLVLNDPNARQTALVTGDVDAISLVDLKTKSLLERDRAIEILSVPSAAAITMPMFCDTAPFTDVNVRNAMKLAMDRDEIIEKIAFGEATKGNDFHHSPAMPYFPEGIEQRDYDPDMARSLLKKAGAEGIRVNLSSADSVFSGAVDMCVLYAEQARKAGITVNVVREPNDGYYSDVWLKKPFTVVSWGARPTPDVLYSLAYKSDATWNESHWQNEEFNKLLIRAKAELDDKLRGEMYRDMALLARNDGGTIIPFFNNFVYAVRSNVATGEDLAPSWELDGARGPSRWWFKS